MNAQNEVVIGIYEVNCILLHALLMDISEWSDVFIACLRLVLNFIKNNFNFKFAASAGIPAESRQIQ